MDLELLEARWRMGLILTSDLPRVADELVAAGHAEPGLAGLAAGRAEARETFEHVLAALGGGAMGHAEAAIVLARSFARQLLDGESPPDLTSKAIGGLRWRGGSEVDAALTPFAHLADRYGAARSLGPLRGLVTPLLDRRARAEARALLRRD